MSGVSGYVSPGHVPGTYKTSGNAPHTNLHDATSDAVDAVAAAVPTALADLADDVDLSTIPTGPQVALIRDPADGIWKPVVIDVGAAAADLTAVPFVANYDPATSSWPQRLTLCDDPARVGIWISRVPGVAKPDGAGYAIDGVDITIIADAP